MCTSWCACCARATAIGASLNLGPHLNITLMGTTKYGPVSHSQNTRGSGVWLRFGVGVRLVALGKLQRHQPSHLLDSYRTDDCAVRVKRVQNGVLVVLEPQLPAAGLI